jgi:lipopolysaccharide heptosyltransferase I
MTASPHNSSPLALREFHRILLIKPSSLGDLVHALPVLHGLRRRYPDARIDWLVGTSFAGLIEGHPEVSHVVRFDRKHYGRMLRNPGVALEFAAFLRDLYSQEYDLVVDLQGLFRSGLMAAATGARVRIGFARAREAAWLFYTHRIHVPTETTHAVDRNYLVASMLGFADVPIAFNLAVTPAQRQRAIEILRSAGIGDSDAFAAVLPGARWDTKRWLLDRFAVVVEELQRRHGLRSVLLAGRDEASTCAALADRCRQPPANLAGRTALPELVAVLERAAVVLCHDSAPMHLAAALNRPIVSILGPTNPARTGAYGTDARVLQADFPCVPCYLRRLSQCRYDHRCMTAIEPDHVLAAITDVLGSRHPCEERIPVT